MAHTEGNKEDLNLKCLLRYKLIYALVCIGVCLSMLSVYIRALVDIDDVCACKIVLLLISIM